MSDIVVEGSIREPYREAMMLLKQAEKKRTVKDGYTDDRTEKRDQCLSEDETTENKSDS